MSKSLIRKNQLHPDLSDLVRDYGNNLFVNKNFPFPYESGNQESKGTFYAKNFFDRNPLAALDNIKTGQITILSEIGPFERKVYSANIGNLNNSDEAIIFFSYTGIRNDLSSKELFLSFLKTNNFNTAGGTPAITEGLHSEPLIGSNTTLNYGFARLNPPGSPNPVNSLNTATLGMVNNANLSYIYVNKDYKKTYTNCYTPNSLMQIPSGEFPNLVYLPGASNNTYAYPTGFTYGDMENQYLKGFLIGVYGVFGFRSHSFNIVGAGANPQSGAAIVFEGAWLEDSLNNTSNLNLSFVNYGPSGLGGVGNGSNPTGLTLNIYILD